jgi:hypothetical protein
MTDDERTRRLRELEAKWREISSRPNRPTGFLICADELRAVLDTEGDRQEPAFVKTVHGGNCGTTPFYLQPGQRSPEYDQGDAVVVWYDDLYNLAQRAKVADTEGDRPMDKVTDLEEAAWGIIANVSGGEWNRQSEEWREAAIRWRGRYNAQITAEGDQPTPPQEKR